MTRQLEKAARQKNLNSRGWNGLRRLLPALLMILPALAPLRAPAGQEAEQELDKSLAGIKFGVLAYVDYSAGQAALPDNEEENYNQFSLTRGYFTVRKAMTDWMGMRLTMDVKQESKAPGTRLDGSYVTRMKYFYAELAPPDLGVFTDVRAEIGLGHVPWLDFEEHVNPYRCQGTMAMERAHLFNSADTGVSLRGNFGWRLPDAEGSVGSQYYDGRFGSWHLGVYNGGGYHAVEENQNKVVEGRLTMRPLPDALPGLQLSYLGMYGEGNLEGDEVVEVDGTTIALEDIPDYVVHTGMISFQHPAFIVTGQYFTALGNQSGHWIDPDGDALEAVGWSAFLDIKIPGSGGKAAIFGRYDWFDQDPDDEWAEDTAWAMTVAGLAFDLHEHNLLVLAWESTDYEKDAGLKGELPVVDNDLGREDKFQAVWQISF